MSADNILDIVLVEGYAKIPEAHQKLKERFMGVQLRHAVNPNQAVAYRAAIQAAITTKRPGMGDELSVQDVTPFSIGIRDSKGWLNIQVPKNSNIPFSFKQRKYTAKDFQEIARFDIFQGEDPVAENNRLLGTLRIKVPPMKKGKVKMEVTTVVDGEGIVKIKAVCLIDGAENDVVIDTFKGRMTKKEIEEGRIRLTKEKKVDGRKSDATRTYDSKLVV